MEYRHLWVNGDLVLSGYIFTDDVVRRGLEGGLGFSSGQVRAALSGETADLTVRLNSMGGNAMEGEAIRALLAAYPGRVTVAIEGAAVSAASLLMLGADEITITAASAVMIHEPRTGVAGTAADLQARGASLEQLLNTVADLYAKRMALPRDEVLALLDRETWYYGQEAVGSGLVDRVVGETIAEDRDASMSAFRSSYTSARSRYDEIVSLMASSGAPSTAVMAASSAPAANGGQSQMDPADEVQTPATPGITMAGPATPPTNPAPAPTALAAQPADPAQVERQRVSNIMRAGQPLVSAGHMTGVQMQAYIDNGTPELHAVHEMLSFAQGAQQPVQPVRPAQPGRSTPAATITRDQVDTRMEGMIQALMGNYENEGAEFRGLRIRSLAMELGGNGYNTNETIRAGMMSTEMRGGALGVSDLSYITQSVMNRTLLTEYERLAADWMLVTGAPLRASDFREMHAVRFGGDFQLKPVAANGELQMGELTDEAEGLKVERRGRALALTFEMIVNDDLGALQRVTREFAQAARIMENSMVWSLFRNTGTKLKSDNTALFHADHGNLAAAAAGISVASVGAGYTALGKMRAFGSKDGDDFIAVQPTLLLGAPARHTEIMQFTADTQPTNDGEVNPYKTLRGRSVANLSADAGGSDDAWYLIDEDLPPIECAHLDGYENPVIETIDGINPRVIQMNAEHIFGAAAIEYRGSYKNPGA